MIEAIFKLPDEKMPRPVAESARRSFSEEGFAESAALEQDIKTNLPARRSAQREGGREMGYGG